MKKIIQYIFFFASLFIVNTHHAMNMFGTRTPDADYTSIVKMMVAHVANKHSNFYPILQFLKQLDSFIKKQKSEQKAGNPSLEDLATLSTKIQCAYQKLSKINSEIAIDTILLENPERSRLQVVMAILEQALKVPLPNDPEQCALKELLEKARGQIGPIYKHVQILQAPPEGTASHQFYTHVTLPQLQIMQEHAQHPPSDTLSQEDEKEKIAHMLSQHQTILSNARATILGAPPSFIKTLFSFSRPSKTKPDILGNPLLGATGLALARRPELQKYRTALQAVSLAQLILGPAINFNKRIQ